MSLARFAEKWASTNYPPTPVSAADLCAAEEKLGARLPEDYRREVLSIGLPRPTIALLDAVVERGLDTSDVSEFFTPSEIVTETLAWRELGMGKHLIAFASDCCGNKFCFDATAATRTASGDRSVWFFDHDFGSSEPISESFDGLISELCAIEPWPTDD